MQIVTVWLLIALGGNGSYYTVPNVSTKTECERLAKELESANWIRIGHGGENYRCVAYEGSAR